MTISDQLFPSLVVGVPAILGALKERSKVSRLYVLDSLLQIRVAVSELCQILVVTDPVYFHLRNPRPVQFDALLKFLEETPLKMVLLVPFDCVPGTILSRTVSFVKSEEVLFHDYLDRVQIASNVKSKVLSLFDRSLQE